MHSCKIHGDEREESGGEEREKEERRRVMEVEVGDVGVSEEVGGRRVSMEKSGGAVEKRGTGRGEGYQSKRDHA